MAAQTQYLELYHYTLDEVALRLKNGETDLFGIKFTGRKTTSSNLADDMASAVRQRPSLHVHGKTAIVKLQVPRALVCDNGLLYRDAQHSGYSPVEIVDIEQVPDEFLTHAGRIRADAKRSQDQGLLSFTRLSSQYVTGYQPLDDSEA